MDVEITIPEQTVTIPEQSVDATIPAPKIVYQNSWLNQWDNIVSAPIFTPSGEGIFRATVAVYVVGTGGGAGGSVTASALLQISGNANMYPPSTGTWAGQFSTGTQYGQLSEFLFGNYSNVPIYLSASTGTTGQGSLTYYDLYVTIEQLQ